MQGFSWCRATFWFQNGSKCFPIPLIELIDCASCDVDEDTDIDSLITRTKLSFIIMSIEKILKVSKLKEKKPLSVGKPCRMRTNCFLKAYINTYFINLSV